MDSYLNWRVRIVLLYIMNTCFVHDENFNKDKEKEIVNVLRASSLYNYQESEEEKKANEEAVKYIKEFLSGEIEELSDMYKKRANIKKLVVKEEFTEIKKLQDKNLIGEDFLNCFENAKNNSKQPKFFIFEEKQEYNRNNNKQ